ncbi:MAG: hypothetical protein Q9222_000870 [Ikaeria aurantiellina]
MLSPQTSNAPNIALITIVCGWVLTILAYIAILFLIRSSRSTTLHLGSSDYFTFLAFAIAVALVVHTTWIIHNEGFGTQDGNISASRRAALIKSIIANEILWTVTNLLIRTNALSFMARILFPIQKLCLALLAFCVLQSLATILATCLICTPTAAAWNSSISGKCGSQMVAYVVLESIGAAIDLSILVMPLPTIWRLNMERRQKMVISALFSVGTLVLIITGLRISAMRFVTAPDFTFSSGYLGLLSELGALLGIICCCVPSLRAVFIDTSVSRSLTLTTFTDGSMAGKDNAQREQPV